MIKGIILIPTRALKHKLELHMVVARELKNSEIVERYNATARSGFFVSEQGIQTVALHHVMKERFGASPVEITENCLVSVTEEVKLVGNELYYFNGHRVG